MIKYIKESTTPNAIKSTSDVVVISDSDDDDDDAKESECKYFSFKMSIIGHVVEPLHSLAYIVIETVFVIVEFEWNSVTFH